MHTIPARRIARHANALLARHLPLSLMLAFTAVPAACAADARFDASLRRLDPDTRLEQVCDLEAMNRIRKDPAGYRPDRAKSDVSAHPQHIGHLLKGSGGAFRSNGRWYAFSFVCQGTPDHMQVLSFSYKIGNVIPEAKWAEYGLWK